MHWWFVQHKIVFVILYESVVYIVPLTQFLYKACFSDNKKSCHNIVIPHFVIVSIVGDPLTLRMNIYLMIANILKNMYSIWANQHV